MLSRIREGRTDLIREYLAAGGRADAQIDGVSLLQWCAHFGDVGGLRVLMQQGESLSQLGENLDLGGAAFHGHWQLCEFLIEHGAKANHAREDNGETALHLAVSRANRPTRARIVRALLAAGADPNATTRHQAPTGAFMRDARCRGETPLHRAAAFADAELIQLLLDAGAERGARDAHGDTPLSWASWHLRPAAVLRLLCFGEHRIHPDNHSDYDHGQGWQLSER